VISSRYAGLIKNLPLIPQLTQQVRELASNFEDLSFDQVERLLFLDPGLVIRVLRAANNPVYGRSGDIRTIGEASSVLGLKTIKSLIILQSGNVVDDRIGSLFLRFWGHSVMTAAIARELAALHPSRFSQEVSYIAGLIHDIGQAGFLFAGSGEYQPVLRKLETNPCMETEGEEQRIFGFDHRHVGSEVLRSWHFPLVYRAVVEEHNSLNITSEHKFLILLISAADSLSMEWNCLRSEKNKSAERSGSFLSALGLSEDVAGIGERVFARILEDAPWFEEILSLKGS